VTSSSAYADPMFCPKILINKQPPLEGKLLAKREKSVKDYKQRHDRICRKYKKEVINIANPKDQARVNKELRDAVRSHAEVWQWRKGGLERHLSKMENKVLKEFFSVMHTASLQAS